MSFLVKLRVCFRYDVFVFLVGSHVDDFVGDDFFLFINLSVRRFDKAVFIDSRERGKRSDKTYVLTFRRFDRTHSAVVRIVNVTDFKRCPFFVKTARSQSGKLSLVRKLCNRVGLVHKLRELRRAEKFFDCACDGSDVDKSLRGDFHVFLRNAHLFFYDSFKSRNTDSELILQKLAHRFDSSVGKVVDIVDGAYALSEPDVVVNHGDYVVDGDVLRHQNVRLRLDSGDDVVLFGVSIQNLF